MSHKRKKAAPEATSEESVTTKSAESQEQPTTTPDGSTVGSYPAVQSKNRRTKPTVTSEVRKNKQVVWHYTYSHHIKEIIASGVLLPPIMCHHYETHNFVPAHMLYSKEVVADAKLLLFSQREDWEPASYRALKVGGKEVPLHRLNDYAAHGLGVFRIGVPRNLLHPWMTLKRLDARHSMAPSIFGATWEAGSKLPSRRTGVLHRASRRGPCPRRAHR